ncbi:phosphoribosylamine--glycine ligase [Geochorda subterranea]|uniref:Phosphoribosylamine--glycine ligase n=1 Tax=Geochorda subterranea TaxID=3109564 RepID=A0ABZ1BQC4_9FIRM|nr:phosphoribosylamine--glycine ligase [Limnochorda sp. LNt]WRP14909.1 phosphoribosylamine--glycine ligase [Limnochorda sp. LNt]
MSEPSALVIGSGGREHALAWALERSGRFGRVYVAPGNAGTPDRVPVDLVEPGAARALVDFARDRGVGLVVVGPEAPLAAGLADRLREAGLHVAGPSRGAARIESSKAFAKQLMERAGVPTAPFRLFADPQRALAYVRRLEEPVVIKADGLAGGKGVVVCDSPRLAAEAVEALMVRRVLGDAGRVVVVERRLTGRELSVMVVTDGERCVALPPARDYKRLLDGDRGPNTGGMGSVAPVDVEAEAGLSLEAILERIVHPTLRALAAGGTPFRGVLYAGLMLTEQGPAVLEFNCRPGDPETQAQLPLVDPSRLADALMAAAGVPGYGLPDDPRWLWRPSGPTERAPGHAVCVVLASAGYPERPRTGDVIEQGLRDDETTLVFHAATRLGPDGRLETAGGRVLDVVGLGRDREEARQRAYAAAAAIRFEGMQCRTDIGR